METASDRAPVADRRMGNMRNGFGEKWQLLCDFQRLQNIDMTGKRANSHNARGDSDATQFRKALQYR